jgi:hypothetical protein
MSIMVRRRSLLGDAAFVHCIEFQALCPREAWLPVFI